MKLTGIIATVSFFSAVHCVAAASDSAFSTVDSVVREAVSVRAKSADDAEKWRTEKLVALAELESLESRVKFLRSKIEAAKNERVTQSLQAAESRALTLEAAYADFDAALCEAFGKILSDPRAKKILAEARVIPERFESLDALEKFSVFVDAVRKLSLADSAVSVSSGSVSTGVFTGACGKTTGDIVILELDGGEIK